MKALVWNAAETMNWEDRDIPKPLSDEVLLEVEAVGICGSEIEGYLGHNSLRVPPLIMGHEFCGRIRGFGSEVKGIEMDQKVVVNPLLYCGECERCRKGYTQLCDQREIIGIHRSGAFAQWVTVPFKSVIPVPDSINSYRASLSEPLACSLRATRRALKRHPLANMLIFGAGGIGLLCAQVARILGARSIMMADTNQERLNLAKRIGAANYIFNPKYRDLKEEIMVFGERGLDVVIDAAGFQPTREAAIDVINPGGTLMNIGLGIDETNLRINHLIRSEVETLGSFCYTVKDFRDAVDLLVNGKITEEDWTEVRPLSDGEEAFAELVAGKVTSGKIFLNPRDGE